MPKTLKQLIDEQMGVRVRGRPNPLISTVDATPLRLFSHNPNRLGLLVINISANNLYILPDTHVTTTNGILLSPQGGSFVGIWKELFHPVEYEWWCVGDGAGTDLFSYELISY